MSGAVPITRLDLSAADLRERRTSGNKSPLGSSGKEALPALVEAGPDPAVHQVVRWRRVDLQKELKVRLGVEVHERTVGKYLADLGYRRLPVRPQHPDSGPEAHLGQARNQARARHATSATTGPISSVPPVPAAQHVRPSLCPKPMPP